MLGLSDRRRVRSVHGLVAADIDLRVAVARVLAQLFLQPSFGIPLLDDGRRAPFLVVIAHCLLLQSFGFDARTTGKESAFRRRALSTGGGSGSANTPPRR